MRKMKVIREDWMDAWDSFFGSFAMYAFAIGFGVACAVIAIIWLLYKLFSMFVGVPH